MSKAIFLPYQTALMTAMQNHLVTAIATSRRTGMSWVALLLTARQGLCAEIIAQIMAGASGAKPYNADSDNVSLKTDNKAGAKIAATSAGQGLFAKTIKQTGAGPFGVKSHNAPPRSAKPCEASS
ncbi:hypothetical protein [Aristophania vespae]|uniref:hypothetical protein n=1 Tax=Aristophania vespae TaxID=2697033 RepID=UPI002351986E|nr:hypothetical protein [Aristophania vespae]UMM63801.1 hypothetical protein DM15PD_07780 [Aristophania vespae]